MPGPCLLPGCPGCPLPNWGGRDGGSVLVAGAPVSLDRGLAAWQAQTEAGGLRGSAARDPASGTAEGAGGRGGDRSSLLELY